MHSIELAQIVEELRVEIANGDIAKCQELNIWKKTGEYDRDQGKFVAGTAIVCVQYQAIGEGTSLWMARQRFVEEVDTGDVDGGS